MPADRLEQSGLNRAWIAASAALPLGWSLEGVAHIATDPQSEQRSDRWRAWALGPNGETVDGEGNGPIPALRALARELEAVRGSVRGSAT